MYYSCNDFRNDLTAITDDYINLKAEDAAESDIPLLFISFPSAKDPTYAERFPGKKMVNNNKKC